MHKTNKAFTLVELIVVITIIAILGTIAFISLQGYSKSSRDSVRIADVSTMKTSLELFHLNSGKYSLPDEYEIVSYESEDLWYQGKFGNGVVSNLSRNLSEIPTDPLTDKEYIYSVANNKNEFQILSLLEGDVAMNMITQTNAAKLTVTPRVDGNYNGIFIKTPTHIVPTPSILTAENIGVGVGLTLDGTNIKSQIITGLKNIPNVGNVNSDTEQLTGFNLSVYTGTLDSGSSDIDKENAILAIQDAYTGSELASEDKINYILSKTTTEDLIALTNIIILKLEETTTVSLNGTCGIDNNQDLVSLPTNTCDSGIENNLVDLGIGNSFTWDCNGLNGGTEANCTANHIIGTYQEQGLCDEEDISVGPYFVASCNLGATLAGTGASSYGNYYQFGKLDNSRINGNASWGYDWKASGGTDGGSANDWGLTNSNSTTATYNTADQIKIQGPCPVGYHVPTNAEWIGVINNGGWGTNGESMRTALKLPFMGDLGRHDGNLYNPTIGFYWSSSPLTTQAFMLYITSTSINPNNVMPRGHGFPVRCFKN